MEITWDLVVLISLAVGTLYGAFVGRNKILGVLVYLYLGLAVAEAVGATAYGWVSNFGIISNQLVASEFGVKSILMLLVAGLLMFKSEISGLDSAGTLSKLQTGIVGFLTSGFILAALFNFMSKDELTSLNSNFALIVYSYRAPLIVAPVLFIILLSFFNKN